MDSAVIRRTARRSSAGDVAPVQLRISSMTPTRPYFTKEGVPTSIFASSQACGMAGSRSPSLASHGGGNRRAHESERWGFCASLDKIRPQSWLAAGSGPGQMGVALALGLHRRLGPSYSTNSASTSLNTASGRQSGGAGTPALGGCCSERPACARCPAARAFIFSSACVLAVLRSFFQILLADVDLRDVGDAAVLNLGADSTRKRQRPSRAAPS